MGEWQTSFSCTARLTGLYISASYCSVPACQIVLSAQKCAAVLILGCSNWMPNSDDDNEGFKDVDDMDAVDADFGDNVT